MNVKSICALAGAAVIGLTLGMSSIAAETKGPSSVNESDPAKTAGKAAKGKSGEATMPSKGPSSVPESAPQKTGKEPPAPAAKGSSAGMDNPKTPSSVNESAPSKATKGSTSEDPMSKSKSKGKADEMKKSETK